LAAFSSGISPFAIASSIIIKTTDFLPLEEKTN